MLVLSYPLDRIDFRPWACAVLGVEHLERLHELPDPKPFADYVERLSHYSGLLRESFHAVEHLYLALVDIVAEEFGGLSLRQRPPSIRCHLAGANTASSMHRDGDPKYGISPGILNCWVPLTEVSATNSLYVESSPGAGDHRPVSLRPGQMMVFDAYHLEHGSLANESGRTRVSFDFRFVPVRSPSREEPPGRLQEGGDPAWRR